MRILITGGGTGGHLFPGIAVADAVADVSPGAGILFAHTGREFEKKALDAAGYQHLGLGTQGFLGRGLKNQLKAGFRLVWAFLRSLGVLVGFRPHVVLGVGGYASVPCMAAARCLFIPAALAEQNALPGRANRLMAKMAKKVYATFPESREYFPPGKVEVTGNPVRKALMEAIEKHGRNEDVDERFHVLVIGGSQGARGINRAVCDSLDRLPPERFMFTHQTGDLDYDDVDLAHRNWGGGSVVRPFFDDMDRRYREADFVVCRSGATTLAEVCALGKAALLVPYPFAADNHQEKNARAMEDEGAAEVILERDLSGDVLARRIEYYAGRPGILDDMRQRARKLGRPRAAYDIAEDLLALVRKTG
ncbi:MAG: undecaprenyldiphospho-muramoylpentapeptide beta-N-acetylglucosaminyltransferase [Desulfatibacillaceae bacterium]